MNQNNPYRAFWEKSQEQSLKLAQYYTPECLVELCLELLQPKGELFDPCCGLGSFLLKAKSKDENLNISGNDIAQDLGELPFEFTQGDYLNSEHQQSDYIIANIPFNLKKTHCQLIDENFCWIEKIIANTRKKALIILPSGVNSGLNPTITKKRIEIMNSGVIELVCQLPSHLFNQTGIAPTIWLINKEKVEKDIYLLNAEKYSEWEKKKRILTAENIKQICQKGNWIKATPEQIKENNFCLNPLRFEPISEKDKEMWEINQKLIKYNYELRYSLHALIADAYQKLMMLEELDDSGEIQLQSCFLEGKKIVELQQKISKLLLEKHF
ncbi:Putative Type I restriction-modification system, M subunit [endosymbiont DhMRE of Dentiscutata heterogama]|uniref:N-6 DNA methylase n=1 Tax=endosymbiont DhMRE of Dentiscutata heterogama TaxID=1609546 RepID=UPI000629D752|nr:N-6 DNA methylase [endosymbiont DhMRE of Dentiscutata heterogama]CFW92942.1 Putative Type I restriction-modification system, M subunit [endosymbiont DhMRE of Dentiscutata heterogama]